MAGGRGRGGDDVVGIRLSLGNYLMQALNFVWNRALREELNFCFSGDFC